MKHYSEMINQISLKETVFELNNHTVRVQYSETETSKIKVFWRLIVDNHIGPWEASHKIYHFQEFYYATNHWDGILPTEIPFQITIAKAKETLTTCSSEKNKKKKKL